MEIATWGDGTWESVPLHIRPNTVYLAGNLGVGTTNPAYKLDISANSQTHALFKGTFAGIQGIQVERSGGDNIRLVTNYTGYGGGLESSSALRFSVNNNSLVSPSMYIKTDGNVGIGTTNPGSYKLAVNGNIRAKEIKVETGWSDFVFKKDYPLPTLQEVEKHIKTNGHLKDIPSAKEVTENGIFLGEMDSKLLQKIEELTLYTIAQEKRINQLESENSKLKIQELKIKEIEVKLNAILANQK